MLETNTQIQHLFRLLDDDNPEIRKIVHDSFLEHSQELIMKKSLYRVDAGNELRPLLDQWYADLHFDLVKTAFYGLLNRNLEDIDLELAVMFLAYWNNPEVDIPALQRQLDHFAQEIQVRMPFTGHPLSFVDHINYYFFKKYHFVGNSTDYYNPDNSFIDKVLETHTGIPISLSVVYILIARRLDLPILGVPMPAHFIVKFDNGTDQIFCDPFYGGKIYSREECLAYLKNASIANPIAILNGATNYQIVLRMMRNIKLVYSSYKDEPAKISQIDTLIEVVEKFYQ